jgi:glycosyltransferase involved in cell wall biosynthesis
VKIAVHLDAPLVQGNERQVLLLAERLRARGHEVVASTRPGGPVEEAFARLGVRTDGARPMGDLDPWNALRFAAWLRRERPDALLLTSWKRAFTGGWAARVAGVPRVVLRVGGTHRVEPGWRGWKRRRALLRYVDAVVANSRAVTARMLQGVPGLAAERIHEVPNGVSLRPAPPAPLRRERGIPDGALVAAGVGALTRRKGFDLLVDALARTGDPALHVVLAGEGPERGELLARAERAGVADRLHLLGQRGDVAAVLAAADLFVLSSRSEGMAVAMLEAMTAGIPVAAADVGGVWDALAARAGRPPAGWIVPPGDAAALAVALKEVAAGLRADPDGVRRRVAEGHWRLENWFTVERMTDGVEAALAGRPFGHAGTADEEEAG